MNPPFPIPNMAIMRAGAIVAGRLLRFLAGGKAEASAVAVDDSGNVTTPGTITAGDSAAQARMGESNAGYVQFANTHAEGHAASGQTGFRQYHNGSCSVKAIGESGVGGETADLDTPKGSVRVETTGCMSVVCTNAPAGTVAPVKGAILQVLHVTGQTPGGFMPPSMTSAVRDTIAGTTPAGVIIYNETTTRLELWTGATWLGISTEV